MSRLIRLDDLALLGLLAAATALTNGCSTPPSGSSYEPLLLGEITWPTGSAVTRDADRTESRAHPAWESPQESEQVEDPLPMDEGDTPEGSGSDGAAGSNPLAAVSKVDLAWEYIRTNSGDDSSDYNLKASTMLHPRIKLNVEAHYWDTDVTGEDEDDFESVSVKPIWFPHDQQLGEVWGLRVAAGAEYIKDFDNDDKGIGTGTDQIGPLFGLAFMNRESKTVLIPLVQHFEDVGSGPNISTTAFRVIALQPLPGGYWAKGDLKLPHDWENEEWPASVEVEGGKMIAQNIGLFLTGLAGLGGDKPYDWGAALAVRVNF